ncbi:MAG TPA: histidine phosphatase family protein [Flavisolibacter sp.]|nr:histidine phosphatase family protein [Flavisolibacter sp.]
MFRIVSVIISFFIISCNTTTYFIVRHAEKEMTNTMSMDVPLSKAGKERAEALKDLLTDKNIHSIYSTNYSRTLSTVEPLRSKNELTIQLYDTKDTLDRFIAGLKKINTGNVLIAGHSNTVPVIVNKLTGKTVITGDLPDTAYGDLYIVKKRGNHFSYTKSHFGL